MRRYLPVVLIALAPAALGDDVRLSHLLVEDLVTRGSGIFCGQYGPPAGSLEASFWNSYTLSDFGISSDVRVRQIEFGVEELALPTRADVTLGINLYLDAPRSPPSSGLPLLASTQITLGETALAIFSVEIDAILPTDRALIVELSVPSLYDIAADPTGDVFIVGANDFGRTAETYISSAPCGILEPQVASPFGWPFSMVMTVVGQTICPADIDENGDLTVFDFLAFQNLFATGDLRADFDGDGVLTVFDFLAFQNSFAIGC